MCSPRRAGKRTSRNVENPQRFGFDGLDDGFDPFNIKFDAKNKNDEFKQIPDLF